LEVFSRPRQGESFKLGFAMEQTPFKALGVKKTNCSLTQTNTNNCCIKKKKREG